MIIGVVCHPFTVILDGYFADGFVHRPSFLEMVFRRIEYWIEGDRGAQIRLKKEWNGEK
jgi:hypothetical protein